MADAAKSVDIRRGIPVCSLAFCLVVGVFGARASKVADAEMRGDHAAIQGLVAQHAGVNAPQADGAITLHWAAFHSDRDTVDLLGRRESEGRESRRLHAAMAGEHQL